ncbi:MAG: hypothetical protein ACE15C_09825 [Phycisphaerae bacterium]
MQPYFDADAVRATGSNLDSRECIGVQPADGNYDKYMPRIRYSRRMDCPSQSNSDICEYTWNAPYWNQPRAWCANWITPGAAIGLGDAWWKPDPPNALRPIRYSEIRGAANFCPIVETDGWPGWRNYTNLASPQTWGYFQILAQLAPHLRTLNGAMMDGHVRIFDPVFLLSYNRSTTYYPFDVP